MLPAQPGSIGGCGRVSRMKHSSNQAVSFQMYDLTLIVVAVYKGCKQISQMHYSLYVLLSVHVFSV